MTARQLNIAGFLQVIFSCSRQRQNFTIVCLIKSQATRLVNTPASMYSQIYAIHLFIVIHCSSAKGRLKLTSLHHQWSINGRISLWGYRPRVRYQLFGICAHLCRCLIFTYTLSAISSSTSNGSCAGLLS